MTKNMNLSDSLIRVTLITLGLLVIPFTANFLSVEVTWSFFDFLIAGILLFGTGVSFMLIGRLSPSLIYKVALGVALFSCLFLVWANLAVGLIGSENEPANLMYFGVLAVGFIGGFLARFKPKGMAYALFSMAISIVVIAVIALAAGMQNYYGSSVTEILGVNGPFFVLYVVSGILFLQSAKDESELDGSGRE